MKAPALATQDLFHRRDDFSGIIGLSQIFAQPAANVVEDVLVWDGGVYRPTASLLSMRGHLVYCRVPEPVEVPVEPPVEEVDVELTSLLAPAIVNLGDTIFVAATVKNNGSEPVSGTVELSGVTNRGDTIGPIVQSFADLPAAETTTLVFTYVADAYTKPYKINWTATAVVEDDTVPFNDTDTASTKVKR